MIMYRLADDVLTLNLPISSGGRISRDVYCAIARGKGRTKKDSEDVAIRLKSMDMNSFPIYTQQPLFAQRIVQFLRFFDFIGAGARTLRMASSKTPLRPT